MSVSSSRRYPPELRERAVRMVAEISDHHESEWAAIGKVAQLLGVDGGDGAASGCAGPRSTRRPAGDHERGVGRAQAAEAGERGAARANAILKAASAFFAAELDRPSH